MGNNQKKWDINTKNVHCPNCGQQQPKVRKPKNWRQFWWGGYTCENCGTEMDKYSKQIKEKS